MMSIGYAFAAGADKALGVPVLGSKGAAGWDVRANFKAPLRGVGTIIEPGAVTSIPSGLILEIPTGFECQVRSRSGISKHHGVFVLNSPGTIDSDFRGELFVLLANFGTETFAVSHGDRVAQLVFAAVPDVQFVEAIQVPKTDRGSGGFGSTGTK